MSDALQDRLAALRNKAAAAKADQETRKNKKFTDNRYYRFFDMEVGGSVTARFLPDGDETNELFCFEKQMFEWKFPDPENPGEQVIVKMPCRNMYEPKSCVALPLLSKVYKQSKIAQSNYVNKTFVYQGFVRKSEIVEPETPENPIRLWDLSKKVHTLLYNAMLSTDDDTKLDSWPVDYDAGYNFVFTKGKQGEYNDFSASKFANRQSALTDDERAAIKQYGLFNLRKEVLDAIKTPTDEQWAIQKEMVEDLLNGEPWNPEWESLWKPFRAKKKGGEEGGDGGDDARGETAPMVRNIEARAAAQAASEDADDGEAPAPVVKKGGLPNSDLLAQIRAKHGK